MNGFNLNATILNVLAPNSVLDMRGGTLSYVTVLSMDGTVRFQELTMGKFISGTVMGTTQTVKVVVIMIFIFRCIGNLYNGDIDVANTLKVTNGSVIYNQV
jgi:hypothetical protein